MENQKIQKGDNSRIIPVIEDLNWTLSAKWASTSLLKS